MAEYPDKADTIWKGESVVSKISLEKNANLE